MESHRKKIRLPARIGRSIIIITIIFLGGIKPLFASSSLQMPGMMGQHMQNMPCMMGKNMTTMENTIALLGKRITGLENMMILMTKYMGIQNITGRPVSDAEQ